MTVKTHTVFVQVTAPTYRALLREAKALELGPDRLLSALAEIYTAEIRRSRLVLKAATVPEGAGGPEGPGVPP